MTTRITRSRDHKNARSCRSTARSRFTLALAGAAGIALAPLNVMAQSNAAKVLDTWGDSLTVYKATTASPIQGIRPWFTQRGVNMDGSLRSPSVQGWALAANPIAEPATGMAMLGDLHLDTGTYAPTEVDLSLPCIGPAWVIGRSHNGTQANATNTGFAVTDYGQQGRNWFQMSQPEIVLSAGITADRDLLYLVYGADRFIEFKRTGTTSDHFKAINGAAGVIEWTAGVGAAPATYTYTDQYGTQSVFFAGDYSTGGTDYPVNGQLWKITDSAGNCAYVGDETTATTAITTGYEDSTGLLLLAFDSAGRRYTYAYASSAGGYPRLTEVEAERYISSTWTPVGTVTYDYYDSNTTDKGLAGDLKLVTITTPLSSGVNLVRNQYYRYYTSSSYNSSTNPGHPGQIRMVVGYEGVRRYSFATSALATVEADMDGASNATLVPYSTIALEYHDANFDDSNSNKYVSKATFNGECGCSGGGGSGEYTFTYDQIGGYSSEVANTAYESAWAKRTVVKRPDNTYETQYFDEVSQPLSRVITGQDPATTITTWWATSVVREDDAINYPELLGVVREIGTPESTSGYNHSSGALTEASSNGLINVIARQDSSSDLDGLPIGRQYRQAGGSTKYYTSASTLSSFTKTISGSVAVLRPLASSSSVFPVQETSAGASTRNETAFTNTAHTASLVTRQNDTSLPAVSDTKNGSGSANTRKAYSSPEGRTTFTRNEELIVSYRAYDPETGQLTKSIQDANTALTGAGQDFNGVTVPSGFSTSGSALHYRTEYTYDQQGRIVTFKSPNDRISRMYYTRLSDGRMVTLSIPRDVSGTYYGPVGYTVSNHAGKVEAQGVIGIASSGTTLSSWISTTSPDPIAAVSVGTLERLSTNIYDTAGLKLSQSRVYHTIPGSGDGTVGSNYDASFVGYDPMGRVWRTKSAAGDIARTVFDALGRPTARWMGTNDNSWSGGEGTGTNNMTEVETMVYDGGSTAGNSHLTSRTLDPDGNWGGTPGDQRTTSMIYDYRGRVIGTNNPESPHSATTYDNLGRAAATAQFTSTVSSSTTPTTTTNRVAYRANNFDEMGRVWKSTLHKVTQSTGVSADSIDTLTWFDPAGRTIKVRGLNQHLKIRYDRLGRAVQQFTLSKDNDGATTYSDVYASGATSVAGDTVVEQSSTGYDNTNKTGLALVRSNVSRHWNASSTLYAELDSNADGVDTTITATNINGRVQITAMWYDALNRLIDTVQLGTNAIVGDGSTSTGTYTRGTTISTGQPSRSDNELRTTYAYNIAGQVEDVTDPRALVARTLYDDAGRKITNIANYTAGSLGTPNRDNDLYTHFTYANGLQTEMWVNIDGDPYQDSDDQVTKYIYGVTKTSSLMPSQVASNSMLRMTIYPDSSATSGSVESGSSTDAVVCKYNALGQKAAYRDQNETTIEFEYDKAGRETVRKVSDPGPTVDTSVLRIQTAYLDRGLPNTVTQYDAATSGTARDQVQYSYDDWGNLIEIEQDVDSAIGTGGRAAFDVEFAWSKGGSSATRTVLRRSSMTMPDATEMTLAYSTTMDDDLSRVREVIFPGDLKIASYEYGGLAALVTTDLKEPEVFTDLASGTTGVYPGWDQFNRVKKNTWKKSSNAFYEVDIAYDRNSNILRVEDEVHQSEPAPNMQKHAFDAVYAVDGINRLTEALYGDWNGSSFSGQSSGELWKTSGGALALSQTGNWANYRWDIGSGYEDEPRTHNVANEILTIDSEAVSHDANGNLTNEGIGGEAGKGYKYVYDAFNRLKAITDAGDAVIQEFSYNGLGHRTGWHYDTDASDTTDGSDPWYYFTYDEKWRIVATYRADDAYPKEQFYYHAAGIAGRGNSSYIDSVILRDAENFEVFAEESDGTLEERRYYCQNWRADVSAILTDTGSLVEFAKFTAYGVPIGLPAGDLNASGLVDSTDSGYASDLDGNNTYDVRADIDLDGDVDADDVTAVTALDGVGLGRGKLSRLDTLNRKGYAGYENSMAAANDLWHVRHRALHSGLGRWVQRDPAGYVDGASLAQYARSQSVRFVDSAGKRAHSTACEDPDCRRPSWPDIIDIDPDEVDFGEPLPTAPTQDIAGYYQCVNDCFAGIGHPDPAKCFHNCSARYRVWPWNPTIQSPYDNFCLYNPFDCIGAGYYWWYDNMPWCSTQELADMSECGMLWESANDAACLTGLGTLALCKWGYLGVRGACHTYIRTPAGEVFCYDSVGGLLGPLPQGFWLKRIKIPVPLWNPITPIERPGYNCIQGALRWIWDCW